MYLGLGQGCLCNAMARTTAATSARRLMLVAMKQPKYLTKKALADFKKAEKQKQKQKQKEMKEKEKIKKKKKKETAIPSSEF